MDETSPTLMLRPEKFMTKKSSFELEASHRAKTDTILLVCNQYVRVISTFPYERESFILPPRALLSVVKKESRNILKLYTNGSLISSQL
jgi:hypothetical protein